MVSEFVPTLRYRRHPYQGHPHRQKYINEEILREC